jgi:hypothetical protein
MALSGMGNAEESLFFYGSCVFCFFLAGGVRGVDAKRRRVGGFGDGFRVWCVVGSCSFLACIRCVGLDPFAKILTNYLDSYYLIIPYLIILKYLISFLIFQ